MKRAQTDQIIFTFLVVAFIAGLFGLARMDKWANASTTTRGEYSHSLKSGVTAFHIRVDSPHKIILYPEAQKVKTVYSIVCIKGTKPVDFAFASRSFTTSYTRNLLYQIPPRQDRCDLVVAATTPTHKGQIVIDVQDH